MNVSSHIEIHTQNIFQIRVVYRVGTTLKKTKHFSRVYKKTDYKMYT